MKDEDLELNYENERQTREKIREELKIMMDNQTTDLILYRKNRYKWRIIVLTINPRENVI